MGSVGQADMEQQHMTQEDWSRWGASVLFLLICVVPSFS